MQPVEYELSDGVARIVMDDGKANALSPAMLDALGRALDQAERDDAVVCLSGRPGLFSGGFDLGVVAEGGAAAVDMFRSGFELAERLLSFPSPTLAACNGHAIAMGAFLLLSCDVRFGTTEAHRFAANEVAIGLTIPLAAAAIVQSKLTPGAADRAITTACDFRGEGAVAAGFLDALVAPDALDAASRETAQGLTKLHRAAHHASKLRTRARTLEAIRAGIEQDFPHPADAGGPPPRQSP